MDTAPLLPSLLPAVAGVLVVAIALVRMVRAERRAWAHR